MPNKVVTLKTRPNTPAAVAAAEVWHGEINQRLATIERILRKLEWQVWTLFCGGLTLMALYVVDRLGLS